jgi:hypothetical protein
MAGPLAALLLILWRYGPVRLVIATLYGIAVAFGWLMQRNIEGWHLTTPLNYVLNGALVLGTVLCPAAVVLSLSSGTRSWVVGLLLTWPLVLLSADLVASGCVISTLGCIPFDAGTTIAGLALPILVVLATWLTAWLTQTVRESLAIFFARDRADRATHTGRSTVPLLGGRPISDDYFAGPMIRGEEAPGQRPQR